MTYVVGQGGTIANYTDLQAAIIDLLNRPDLANQPQTWIQLAEAQMSRVIRSRWMLSRSQTFTISSEYVSVPSDFVGVKSFIITSTTPAQKLTYQSPEVMDELSTLRWNWSDAPMDYTILGSEFRFSPIPGQSYTAQLTYYQRIPALASNATNWLLTNHPDAYLYGSALQAVPYLSDDDRVETWAAIFQQIVNDINTSDFKESQGQSLRSRPAFAP
jgi:hypothetical protein